MLVQFRKQLRGIEEELKRVTTLEDADEELFTPNRTMLEILNAFAEESCLHLIEQCWRY